MLNRLLVSSTLVLLIGLLAGCSRSSVIRNGIVLRGHGEVKAVPDVAELSITVVARDRTNSATKALAVNARKVEAVRKAMTGLKVATKDITTESFEAGSVQPDSGYPRYRPVGRPYFEVTNSLRVTTKDINGIGKMIDAALKAGATSIDGVRYRFDHPAELQAKALARAVEDAKIRAKEVARAGGVRLLPVSSVVQAGLEGTGAGLTKESGRLWERLEGPSYGIVVAKPVARHTYALPREEVIAENVTVTFAIERR